MNNNEKPQELSTVRYVTILVCSICATVLMITSVTSTNWFKTPAHRQGLFTYCIEDLNKPLPPFLQNSALGCYPIGSTYVLAIAACSLVGILTICAVALFTGLGLWSESDFLKIRYYMWAAKVLALPVISMFAVIIVYPVCFGTELAFYVISESMPWYIGWAYGLYCGAGIFVVGCVILFM